MSVLSAVGFALVAVFMCFLLRESGFKGVKAYSSVAVVLLFAFSARGLESIFSNLTGYASELGASEVFESMGRIIGVGYAFGFSADICSELGEGGIAKALLTAGRVELVLMGFPYFNSLYELAVGLVGG